MNQPRRRATHGKVWHEPGYGEWISFDLDQNNTDINTKYSEHCRPCLISLYQFLCEPEGEFDMGPAYHCWKLIGVTDSNERSRAVVEEIEKITPENIPLFGKYGGMGEDSSTSAVILYVNDDTMRWVKRCLEDAMENVYPAGEIKTSKGCADIHGELFGPWKDWKKSMKIKHRNKIPPIMETLRNK